MTSRTKTILINSIQEYKTFSKNKQEEMLSLVKENLEIHYRGVNNIGLGLDEDKVRAGEIFLRTIKN